MTRMKNDPKVRGTLTLLVEFEDISQIHESCAEIIEAARMHAWPAKATLEIMSPCIEELV